MFFERDAYWMQQAIQLAKQAEANDEVPVGAILVLDDQQVGSGCNQPITMHDPTAHAEIMALRSAAKTLENYRLINTTLYVTLEPCMMCVGAMVHARIKRLVFGAADAKAGAVVSQESLLDKPFLNYKISHQGGLLALECGNLLSEFFQKKRRTASILK